jgi:MoaA/NifB/PqqE/SkfB family radical SAM enzyme
MAYIQITTKCNMSCAHCCFSCNLQGENMSSDIFKKALEFCDEHDQLVTIGGGEPTLHPKFRSFLRKALKHKYEHLLVVTNGTNPFLAFEMLDIIDIKNHSCAVFEVALSRDKFHSPIESSVVRVFEARKAIRTVHEIRPQGRALENQFQTRKVGCSCNCITIKTNGDVYLCACSDAPYLGNVKTGLTEKGQELYYDEEFRNYYCWGEYKAILGVANERV